MRCNSEFIDYSGQVLLPYQTVEIHFCVKEDSSLNPFQELILEAIEQECDISQIVNATLLTPYAIESEINQLISQKLLCRQDNSIKLTALSKKILLVSHCVAMLNDEHQKARINMITGSIEKNEDNYQYAIEENNLLGLRIRPRILKQEIDGIGVEDNSDFFQSYMRTFEEMEEESITAVLSSVFADLRAVGKIEYLPRLINKIPCLIGKTRSSLDETKENDPDLFFASGKLCKIRYSLKSELVEANRSVLHPLTVLVETDETLVSPKGRDLFNIYKTYQTYKNEGVVYVYDYCSGLARKGCLTRFDSGRNKVDFEVPLHKELTKEYRKTMMEQVALQCEIPDGLQLEEMELIDENYVVCGRLSDLIEGMEW